MSRWGEALLVPQSLSWSRQEKVQQRKRSCWCVGGTPSDPSEGAGRALLPTHRSRWHQQAPALGHQPSCAPCAPCRGRCPGGVPSVPSTSKGEHHRCHLLSHGMCSQGLRDTACTQQTGKRRFVYSKRFFSPPFK